MDIDVFRTFILVAKHKSISKTCGEIHLTQPAITKQLKALGIHYGVNLFERKRNTMVLTEEGNRLLGHAQRIISVFDESFGSYESDGADADETLSIAANFTVGIFVLPRLIKAYSELHPGVKIKMSLNNTGNVIRAIKKKHVNFGFIGLNVEDPLISAHLFFEDKLKLVVAQAAGIARNSAGWNELRGIPFIVWERGSGIRDTLERWLKERDIKLTPTIELNNTEAIKECIRYGLGFSILPWCTVKREVQSGLLHVISVPYLDLTVRNYICHYKERKFSRSERTFLEFLFQSVESTSV